MRKSFVQSLCDEASVNPKIFLLTGDLGFNILEMFRDKYPKRFLNVGVAESNLVNVAAGLSKLGFIPFIYSIATFMSMRPFEQIRNNISLQNMNVKIIGVGGGIAYTKAGPTHHSMEDIALIRTLPNILIINPSDQKETFYATKAISSYKGPVYMRIERNPEFITTKTMSFKIGKGRIIKKGKNIAILATGAKIPFITNIALILEKKKIYPTLVSMPSINPLDLPLLKRIALMHKIIVTVEEHRVNGGFGTAVMEFLSTNALTESRILRVGLKNEFSPISGDYHTLAAYHGFTPELVSREILKAIK